MPKDLKDPARKLVVGNWKMHGVRSALGELTAIDDAARQSYGLTVGLALPATLISTGWVAASAIQIGAQDIHAAEAGAFTGCVSAAMVKDAGASFTLVGHSECRAGRRETNADVRAKLDTAKNHGLSAILCVGESLEARESGDALGVVRSQLLESLPDHANGDWLSVAYEPVWAIGTGMTPNRADVEVMHLALRQACYDRYGVLGLTIRLLYGGSVTATNTAALMALPEVDGVLVGGASLTAEKFVPIVVAAHEATRRASPQRA